jgi:hypothetical protein
MTFLLLAAVLGQLAGEYNAGDYEQVVQQAPESLAVASTASDSVRVLELYAFSLVALGRNRDAEQAFRQVLHLKPGLELDPETTSPKIRAVFDAVRQEQHVESVPVPTRRDTLFPARRASLPLLIPGLSQVRNHRPAKGYALLSAGALSLVGIGIGSFGYNSAHQTYLQANDPRTVQNRYSTANRWFRTRTVFIGTTSLVWLYSLIDGLVKP